MPGFDLHPPGHSRQPAPRLPQNGGPSLAEQLLGPGSPGDSIGLGVTKLPSLQQRSLGRILTPEWAKLLSLSTADWTALLQPQAQAQPPPQGEQQRQQPAAKEPAQPAQAQQAEQHAPPEGQQEPACKKRRVCGLTPSSSGLQAMEDA